MRKYRLFGIIPIFDLIIVAVLIIALIVGYNVFNTSKSGDMISSTETKTIRYTVEFYNISSLVDGVPEVGEVVHNNATNFEMGKVIYAETTPTVVYGMNDITGETVETVCQDRQTIKIIVEAQATVSEIATEVNTVKIGIGRTITFNMPSLCASGVIKNIETVEG